MEFKTKAEAQDWVRSFIKEFKRPCVVLLSGEMGAGKTQFVRWFLEALNVASVASPTFAIHHRYASSLGDIDHVDLYRLEDDQDLEASGFWDLFTNDEGLVFVEWADRLPESSWPSDWLKIHIQLSKGSEPEARVLHIRRR